MKDSNVVMTSVQTPVGAVRLVANEHALCGVFFAEHRHEPVWVERALRVKVETHAVLMLAADELEEFFAGRLRTFRTPLAANGTAFQAEVWQALREIPFGEQRSYTQQASLIGKPRAVRAVASANAHNPLSIFVPCHRVVAKGGALSGYAGGLAAKDWLLAHERRVRASTADLGGRTRN